MWFDLVHSQLVLRASGFYSQECRTWAACVIQAAWRMHSKRKIFFEQLKEWEAELTTHSNARGRHRTSYSLWNQKILMKSRKRSYSNFPDDSDYNLEARASAFYSHRRRIWAACVIQASWRTYSKRKFLKQQLNEGAHDIGAVVWALQELKCETDRESMQRWRGLIDGRRKASRK